MKKLLLFCFLLCGLQSAFGQTIDVQYINPLLGDYGRYKFVRLGTSLEHYSGWMWNNTDPVFGNGNDVSLFTYGDRDLTFYSGYGNIVFFPSKGGKIGVGTTSPESKLEVVQSGTIGRKFNPAGAHLRLNDGGNSLLLDANEIYGGKELILGFNPSSYFELNTVSSTGYASLMRVDGNGNVGIGTTTTTNGKLTVNGHNTQLRLENDVNGEEARMRLRTKNAGGQYMHADIALYANGSSVEQGFLGFKVPYNNTAGAGYSMIINQEGKVGIGTTAPQAKLHVGGAGESFLIGDQASTTHPALRLLGGYTNGFTYIQAGGAASPKLRFTKYSTVDQNLEEFQVFATESFFSGKIGIGVAKPKDPLHVYEGAGSGTGTTLRLDAAPDLNPNMLFSVGGANYANIRVADSEQDQLQFQTYNGAWVNAMSISKDGKVGLGTDNPERPLEVYSANSVAPIRMTSARAGGADSYLEYKNQASAQPNTVLGLGNWGSLNGGFIVRLGDGSVAPSEKFRINANGNVGIGTASPGEYKLAVNGDVKAKKVNVTLEGWSDFVFEEDYTLRPLSEVEQFIKTHKHLPDVPSEAEVLEKGVELGEMNSLLLQKIEELTLYQIELLKMVEKLEQKVAALEEEKK